MASCPTFLRGRRMRLTRVDICGRPVYGPCSVVVTKGFVKVTLKANTDKPDDIEVKNASGETCVYVPSCPVINGYSPEIEFCQVDFAAFMLMNPTHKPITDDNDE